VRDVEILALIAPRSSVGVGGVVYSLSSLSSLSIWPSYCSGTVRYTIELRR
jgi:hypothetical protein